MKLLTCLISFALIIPYGHAQESQKKPDELSTPAELVEKQRYEFVAESAMPMRGRTIFLSPGYSFKVLKDTIISNLPYYGRAYQATLNPSDAGMSFTSTDFEYLKKDRKKGGWELTIKPKDVNNSPQAYLTISSNGSATLRINASDRQSISYNGRIRKP